MGIALRYSSNMWITQIGHLSVSAYNVAMSLIKCSECGKEVSDHAVSCPSCGNPISTHNVAEASRPVAPVEIELTSKKWKKGLRSP